MSRSTLKCASVEALENRQLLSTVFALTGSSFGGWGGYGSRNDLIRFDSATPGTINQRVRITGTQSGESLRGIDFRPATGELYLLGITRRFQYGSEPDSHWGGTTTYTTRIYKLNTTTGAATQVGTGFTDPALRGSWSGIDFNPVVDRLRYVNDLNQNMRIHPDTGAPIDFDPITPGIQPDLNLAYAAGDPNAGRNPDVTAVAYLNADNDPTTGTTLYGIDTRRDVLVTHNPPNNGTLNTVGALGVNAGVLAGFDIETVGTQNTAYAALQTSSYGWGGYGDDGGWGFGGSSSLYRINLTTGAATRVGRIGSGDSVVGIAVAPGAQPAGSSAPSTHPRTVFADRPLNERLHELL